MHSNQIRANYGAHLVTQRRVMGFENASEHFEMSGFGLERTDPKKYKTGGRTVTLILCSGSAVEFN